MLTENQKKFKELIYNASLIIKDYNHNAIIILKK